MYNLDSSRKCWNAKLMAISTNPQYITTMLLLLLFFLHEIKFIDVKNTVRKSWAWQIVMVCRKRKSALCCHFVLVVWRLLHYNELECSGFCVNFNWVVTTFGETVIFFFFCSNCYYNFNYYVQGHNFIAEIDFVHDFKPPRFRSQFIQWMTLCSASFVFFL